MSSNVSSIRTRFALLSRSLPLLPLLLLHARAQTSAPVPFAAPTTLVGTGRALPSILDQVQKRFLSPISFEEVPFESPSELSAVTATVGGAPNTMLTNPRFDFSVTLDNSAATTYLAAQAVVDAYSASGGPGVYHVVQRKHRVDVVPFQVLSIDGSLRNVQPL